MVADETSTLLLHYNAVTAWLPNIFPVYCVRKCQQTIAVYTMQAVTIVLSVYFLAKFDTSLIFLEAVSTGHSIYNAFVIGDHV